MTLVFDTLSYAHKLREAGFTEEQARAQAEALAEIASENLATKSDIAAVQRDIAALQRDIKELETALRSDMKEMETGLRRDMKEMETGLRRDMKEMETRLQMEIAAVRREIAAMGDKLTIRLGGMLVAGIAILAAIVKVL